MKNFFDLFVHELKDIYNAEKQIMEMLPLFESAASQEKLKKAFNTHLEETREHIIRIQTIAKLINVSVEGHECTVFTTISKELLKILKADYPTEVRDAALISCAQRIEHYEIALYGTLKSFAKHLELKEAECLLDKTSKEEGHADKLLSEIAVGTLFKKGINQVAARNVA